MWSAFFFGTFKITENIFVQISKILVFKLINLNLNKIPNISGNIESAKRHTTTCALQQEQKTCLRVILGRDYEGYESALEVSNLETLEVRREKLCLSFGKKCLLSSNHRSLFPRNIPLHNHNLREQNLFTVVQARTERLRRSCITFYPKITE